MPTASIHVPVLASHGEYSRSCHSHGSARSATHHGGHMQPHQTLCTAKAFISQPSQITFGGAAHMQQGTVVEIRHDDPGTRIGQQVANGIEEIVAVEIREKSVCERRPREQSQACRHGARRRRLPP
ncbi:hypothetical protein ACTMU2_15505 [Cupriavidus basilensis]